jgi:uncharacterized membrane protein
MNGTEIVLTLISVFLIGWGQILFKLAAQNVAFTGFTWQTVALWLTPALVSALVVSTLATGLWVWVLRSANLSVVYPLYALTFVLVPALEWLVFGTALTMRHATGAAVIVVGVWLMAGASS